MTLSTAIRLPIAVCGIACAIAVLAIAPHAAAQDAVDDADQVFATVDGTPITAGDLLVAAEEYAQQLGQAPGNVPIAELLNVLIDMQLLAKAAEEVGIDEDDAVKRRLAFDRARTLRNAYLRDGAQKAVTDESVRARFDQETAEFEPEDELHLHHILVETEDEGREIIADIAAGGDFAAIAKERSRDPGSAQQGGDLDFISRGVTVPEFEEAAFALEVGEVTEAPVQSAFGWHVIKLEEKRKSLPPEFAAEEARIRSELLREFVTDEIATLREAAEVEIVQPEASAADEAPVDGGESAPASGGEAPQQ